MYCSLVLKFTWLVPLTGVEYHVPEKRIIIIHAFLTKLNTFTIIASLTSGAVDRLIGGINGVANGGLEG